MKRILTSILVCGLCLLGATGYSQTFIEKKPYKKEPKNKYAVYLIRQFNKAWDCAEPRATLVITAELFKDGHLDKVQTTQSSGNTAIDNCGVQSVQSLSPLRRPKDHIQGRNSATILFIRHP